MSRFNTSSKTVFSDSPASIVVSREKEHRDLDLGFTLHPIKKDLVPLRDDRAITQSLMHILSTNEFERPFNKDFGANIRNRLFEPNDALTRIFLRQDIEAAISRSEPRVQVTSIDIKNNESNDSYIVKVNFIIIEFSILTDFTIELRRLR